MLLMGIKKVLHLPKQLISFMALSRSSNILSCIRIFSAYKILIHSSKGGLVVK